MLGDVAQEALPERRVGEAAHDGHELVVCSVEHLGSTCILYQREHVHAGGQDQARPPRAMASAAVKVRQQRFVASQGTDQVRTSQRDAGQPPASCWPA